MSSSTRVSLLDRDVVRRRESVRSIVGRAWGRLHGALASSRGSVISAENPEEDADLWQQLEDADDANDACRGYIAVSEASSSAQYEPNDRLKSAVDSGELCDQENVSANKASSLSRDVSSVGGGDGYISYTNDAECGDKGVVKQSAGPETSSSASPAKHQAVKSGGYVAFA